MTVLNITSPEANAAQGQRTNMSVTVNACASIELWLWPITFTLAGIALIIIGLRDARAHAKMRAH